MVTVFVASAVITVAVAKYEDNDVGDAVRDSNKDKDALTVAEEEGFDENVPVRDSAFE